MSGLLEFLGDLLGISDGGLGGDEEYTFDTEAPTDLGDGSSLTGDNVEGESCYTAMALSGLRQMDRHDERGPHHSTKEMGLTVQIQQTQWIQEVQGDQTIYTSPVTATALRVIPTALLNQPVEKDDTHKGSTQPAIQLLRAAQVHHITPRPEHHMTPKTSPGLTL
ncbi:hypothetical protein BDV27DRAFT_132214 [Aspergillus caelatus]|uniref:Uncharacterized protein n=1 Tax=Aspergillus caelatus TaxID=61420 RepID=A0A5N6ZX37_9EURO|nr:uncharacterized protein BDV27DRAFT_132214 [Aspergillus caelatus]KAE8361965.1 hypothetical protein BDV27DRAFT_132214 [Aspergillus caelatus]